MACEKSYSAAGANRLASTVTGGTLITAPMKTRILTFCCAAAILLAHAPKTYAIDDGSAEAVAADILLVRPVCFVSTIIGSALFIVALPVAAISKSTQKTAHALVVRPAQATFTRPLGDMSDLE
jgi:hypothetical protein